MPTYWILDTRTRAEVVALNLTVFGVEPKIFGLANFHRNYAGPRFVVLDLKSNAAEELELLPRPKNGWHGPYWSREDADSTAQLLNADDSATSSPQLPKYQTDFLAFTEQQLALRSLRRQSRKVRALGGVAIEEDILDSISETVQKALKRTKSEWQRRIDSE